MAVLKEQLSTYTRSFQDLNQQMVQIIGERQREANREFAPVIGDHLLSAYRYCTAEHGMWLSIS